MITIESEAFDAKIFAEMLPLIRRCFDECTVIKGDTCAYHGQRDFLLTPDFDIYEVVARTGKLSLIVLRVDGVMRGYVIGFVHPTMHHKGITGGIGDSIYVEPEYRVYSAVLIDKFEQAMRNLKVDIIGWPTHIDGPIYPLLKARGFVGDDIVMEKKL